MKMGSEEKTKVYVLAVLGVVAAGMLYVNVLSGPDLGPPPKSAAVTERERLAAEAAGTAPAAPASSALPPVTEPRRQLAASNRSRNDEFHPSLRSKRKEDQIDPWTVDPTLRLDLLAKVQGVKLDGGQRNLFQFGKSEAPVEALKGPEPKIQPKREAMGPHPAPPPPPPPGPPPPPQSPPITFKYYGVATKRIDNKKTAFFLDGEEIILATENMNVKKRWRVVRINADSVVLEDVELKREQTLRIAEDAGGGNA
ncbi:MAG: hypothetical protein ABI759_06960 [Candidatus Solibacter sp.]